MQGLKLTLIGLSIGAVLALACTRMLRSALLGVSATDALTFVAVAVLLAIVGLIACCLPARCATQVEPMSALRYE